MGYRVKYDELYDVSEEIRVLVEQWCTQLSDVNTKCEILQNSSAFRGQAAENISNYFTEVHGTLLYCFSLLVEDLKRRSSTYANLYRREVDSGTHAVLYEQELKYEIPMRMEQLIGRARDANYRADLVGRDVSDLVGLPYPGGDRLANQLEEAREYPLRLHNRVEQYESAHRNDFDNIDSLIAQVNSILHQQTSRSRVQPVVYTQGGIESMCNLEMIQTSSAAVETETVDLESDFTEALEQRKAWEGELRQEREEKAKWIKLGVGIACAAVSVAVTVATGGAAAPLMLAAIGAVEGAVIGATDAITDQYVDGTLKDGVNWKKLGKSVAIGAVTGFVTGYVGGKLSLQSKVGKTLGDKLLEKTSTSILKTTTQAVTGTVYDVVYGIAEGQSVTEIYDEAKKNWNKVPSEIVKGSLNAIVGTVADEAFEGTIGKLGDELGKTGKKLFDYDNASSQKKQVLNYIGNAVWGSVSDTGKGITNRVVTETVDAALLEGKNLFKADTWKEIGKEVFAADQIVEDATKGGLDGVENTFKKSSHTYQNRKLEAVMEELQDENGKVEFVYFGNDESTVVLKRDYDKAVQLIEKYQNDHNRKNDKITVRDILGTRTDLNPKIVSYTTSEVRAPYYQANTKAVKASVK